ncbi:MAG TPA: beta-propeller fold lactonase family protein [Acidimicrobiales bacterium]|nr:beta-propeller fold lactonase family protein [Acidimicrobiales bacterium]
MSDPSTAGGVFVQTNEARNRVVAFARSDEGLLDSIEWYETGGAGDATPHLPSQGSVSLTGDGGHLLVTNVGSGDVSVFTVLPDATLELAGRAPAAAVPRSVAEHHGLVYVLATGKAAVIGYRLVEDRLQPIAGGEQSLATLDADPAHIGFTPDGSALIVTERGTDTIAVLPVDADGRAGAPHSVASSGPTPYGFAATSTGTLVVTEAYRAEKGAAAASSYRLDGTAVTPVTRSAGNGRSEICWAVVTPDDQWAFTTNFADGAVSRYAIGDDGSLVLDDATAGVTVDGRKGLRDLGMSADGRYLYALDADAGSVFGWDVGPGGSLEPAGSWGGLPATAAGLSAR